MEQDFASDIELSASVSPPEHANHLDSAFGPLDKRGNRKTLWMLISTLNLSFPDYDFSTVSPDSFNREPSASAVLASLSNALNHLRSSAASPSASLYRSFSSYTAAAPSSSNSPPEHSSPTHPFLRQILDPIIGLEECEVYSYAPDVESDPHAAESELGSAAPSEVEDDDLSTQRGEEEMWPMDGFATPANSVPSTPLASHARKLRSGKAYLTGQSSFAQFRQPLRSRSQTPGNGTEESSTGGFLWSCVILSFCWQFQLSTEDPHRCNYFFYNKSKKRMLFISHHMKRVFGAPATGGPHAVWNLENSVPFDDHFKTPSTRNLRSRTAHKRRASATSLASSRLDDAKRLKASLAKA
jgi:hypothetical protein